MTTSQIVWTVVIIVAALLVIGLILGSMRKKSQANKHAQAEELRSEATTDAAVLPDARARAEQADAQAKARRIEAERADKDAAIARTELDQQQAAQEDRIRAADRLDPRVDHKAKDYSPEVVDPAGPSNLGADNAAIAGIGSETVPDATTTSTTASSTTRATETPGAGSSVTLDEPTDTTPRDESIATDRTSLHDRVPGDAPEGDSAESTDTDPQGPGGAHRA